MRKRERRDDAETSTAPALPDPAIFARKPSWPSGLAVSNSQNRTCSLPDDLRVLLTQEAFEQLFAYAYATRNEISCLGVVRRSGNTFIVERFHLVKQEGGMARTEMDPAALGELMEKLLAEGHAEEARSLKCWAHSHPGMGVFWSKTDDTTCRLLASDYLVSLVVSDDFAVRCRIDVANPVPFTVDNVPVLCEVGADKAKLEGYAKEVGEKVKERPLFLPGAASREERGLSVPDDEPWSDYFNDGYGIFDEEDEETGELEPLIEDMDLP